MFLMLSLKGLSISSVRLLIALLDVCSSDTITAEYDVVTNSDSVRVNRKTIRDDKISGDRELPAKQQGGSLFAAVLHSKVLTAKCYTAKCSQQIAPSKVLTEKCYTAKCSQQPAGVFILLHLNLPKMPLDIYTKCAT
jgi:hypothetical protein